MRGKKSIYAPKVDSELTDAFSSPHAWITDQKQVAGTPTRTNHTGPFSKDKCYSEIYFAAFLSTSKHLIRSVFIEVYRRIQNCACCDLIISLEWGEWVSSRWAICSEHSPDWPVNTVHRLVANVFIPFFLLFFFYTGTYFPILKSNYRALALLRPFSVCCRVCNHLFMHYIPREGIVIPAVILYSASTQSRPCCARFTPFQCHISMVDCLR